MNRIISCLVISCLVVGFSFPVQAITLVPECSGSGDCTLCDFLAVLINFTQIIGIVAGTSAVLMLIIGGLMWIIAGANEGMIEKGKKIIISTFTGLVIVFFAWTIVNFMIYALAGGQLNNVRIFSQEWWSPDCKEVTTTSDAKCEGKYIGDSCYSTKKNFICYRELATKGGDDRVCGANNSSTKCSCITECESLKLRSPKIYTAFVCVPAGTDCIGGYTISIDEGFCLGNQKCCLRPN